MHDFSLLVHRHLIKYSSSVAMSHSITTAASYLLNKYSRSYPPTASPARAPAQVEHEWQHFTNPVMRIILEAKKSPSGKLGSMRLKILWNLHTEPDDSHIDQRDVVFVRYNSDSSRLVGFALYLIPFDLGGRGTIVILVFANIPYV